MIRVGHQLRCPTRSRHLYTPLRNRNNRIDACGLSTTPDDGTPSVPDALSSASTTAAGLAAAAGGGGWAGGSADGEGCRRGLKMRTMMRPDLQITAHTLLPGKSRTPAPRTGKPRLLTRRRRCGGCLRRPASSQARADMH